MTLANTSPTVEQHAPAALYRLIDVERTYQQGKRVVKALAGVTLVIDEGDFVTIQGPTGGGKSTLLQMLGALDRPTSGELHLGDLDLSKAPDRKLQKIRAESIGFVFQHFSLIPTLTAEQNVDMGLEPLGLSKAQRKERVAEALAHVGLSERADHLPTELSGGQQQRVAIARALAKRPQVLLADEPTGNLDEATRDDILDLLQGLNEEGLTLIVVTHDSVVAQRANRRLRIERGTVRDITI